MRRKLTTAAAVAGILSTGMQLSDRIWPTIPAAVSLRVKDAPACNDKAEHTEQKRDRDHSGTNATPDALVDDLQKFVRREIADRPVVVHEKRSIYEQMAARAKANAAASTYSKAKAM